MPIVEATATFVAAKPDLAKRLEQAMAGAVLQAVGEGVTDPAEIKTLLMKAYGRVKVADDTRGRKS